MCNKFGCWVNLKLWEKIFISQIKSHHQSSILVLFWRIDELIPATEFKFLNWSSIINFSLVLMSWLVDDLRSWWVDDHLEFKWFEEVDDWKLVIGDDLHHDKHFCVIKGKKNFSYFFGVKNLAWEREKVAFPLILIFLIINHQFWSWFEDLMSWYPQLNLHF